VSENSACLYLKSRQKQDLQDPFSRHGTRKSGVSPDFLLFGCTWRPRGVEGGSRMGQECGVRVGRTRTSAGACRANIRLTRSEAGTDSTSQAKMSLMPRVLGAISRNL
jgi:hypothetical protein